MTYSRDHSSLEHLVGAKLPQLQMDQIRIINAAWHNIHPPLSKIQVADLSAAGRSCHGVSDRCHNSPKHVEVYAKFMPCLSRTEPERPLGSIVLSEDGEHALHRPEDGSVDHDRPLMPGLCLVLQVESDGQLEV